ncbi:MAG: pantetheine-phosphate adenylyltransferase [Candidatus Bathyarchaeota archaeon]|nr:MAG: pantetheine-phosphate adenylyltransferase [Candidatus Bathyarchaeota archaeon]
MKKRFKNVAVGGTFDELHKGHRALIIKAFEVGQQVSVGLSVDELVQKMRKPHKVATYDVRLEELKNFLRRRGLLERAEFVPLYDRFGITLSSNELDALVVSQETESVALEINKKRRAKGLHSLNIILISMIPAEDHVPISTGRIRSLEIDREGKLLKP